MSYLRPFWVRLALSVGFGITVLWALLSTQGARAQERYDPITDPNVQAYMVCIQLASGGGDNSNVPDASNFDEVGYVTWSNGLGKAILCQDVEKS
jgi:hypothetical protein